MNNTNYFYDDSNTEDVWETIKTTNDKNGGYGIKVDKSFFRGVQPSVNIQMSNHATRVAEKLYNDRNIQYIHEENIQPVLDDIGIDLLDDYQLNYDFIQQEKVDALRNIYFQVRNEIEHNKIIDKLAGTLNALQRIMTSPIGRNAINNLVTQGVLTQLEAQEMNDVSTDSTHFTALAYFIPAFMDITAMNLKYEINTNVFRDRKRDILMEVFGAIEQNETKVKMQQALKQVFANYGLCDIKACEDFMLDEHAAILVKGEENKHLWTSVPVTDVENVTFLDSSSFALNNNIQPYKKIESINNADGTPRKGWGQNTAMIDAYNAQVRQANAYNTANNGTFVTPIVQNHDVQHYTKEQLLTMMDVPNGMPTNGDPNVPELSQEYDNMRNPILYGYASDNFGNSLPIRYIEETVNGPQIYNGDTYDAYGNELGLYMTSNSGRLYRFTVQGGQVIPFDFKVFGPDKAKFDEFVRQGTVPLNDAFGVINNSQPIGQQQYVSNLGNNNTVNFSSPNTGVQQSGMLATNVNYSRSGSGGTYNAGQPNYGIDREAVKNAIMSSYGGEYQNLFGIDVITTGSSGLNYLIDLPEITGTERPFFIGGRLGTFNVTNEIVLMGGQDLMLTAEDERNNIIEYFVVGRQLLQKAGIDINGKIQDYPLRGTRGPLKVNTNNQVNFNMIGNNTTNYSTMQHVQPQPQQNTGQQGGFNRIGSLVVNSNGLVITPKPNNANKGGTMTIIDPTNKVAKQQINGIWYDEKGTVIPSTNHFDLNINNGNHRTNIPGTNQTIGIGYEHKEVDPSKVMVFDMVY